MRKIYPLMGVFDDVVISRKGAITCGWELEFPVAYSIGEAEYDAMLDALASAVRVLAPWSVVHRQDMYLYRDYVPERTGDGFLQGAYARRFDGVRHLVHTSYLFVTQGTKGLIDKPGGTSGLFGIGSSAPVPTPEDFAMFRTRCRQFQEILKNAGIGMRVLGKRDWLGEGTDVGILQRYLQLGSSSPVMQDLSLTAEAVGVRGRTAMVFNIAESKCLPGEISNVQRVDALSGPAGDIILSSGSRIGLALDCEHCVNQMIVVPPQQDILRELDTQRKDMNTGLSSSDNRINEPEIQSFLDDAYREGLYAVKAHTNLIVWGPDNGDGKDQLDLIGKATLALTSMHVEVKATAVECRHNAPVVWYASAPGSAYEIGEESLMKMELRSALCLGIFETYERGIRGGILRLCDRIRHIPFEFDIQAAARQQGYVDNYNAFVLGASGTGKSYLMNLMLRQMYDAGEHVFVIDVGDSYEGLCHIVREESGGRDGQYFQWDAGNPITFSFFHDCREWLDGDGNIRQESLGFNFVMSWLETAWKPEGGWTPVRVNVLRRIVQDFILKMERDGVEKPLFNDFMDYVSREVHPRINYRAKSPEDYRNEWRSSRLKEYKKKKMHIDDAVLSQLDIEASAWMSENRESIEASIRADVDANGFRMGVVQITPQTFRIDDFTTALEPYTGNGIYSSLLNSPEPMDLESSRFIVFEVKNLADGDSLFYSLCVLLITHTFEVKMRRRVKDFKVLVIDEAWKAIANETMAPYLQSLWKTARKYNASGVCVSQEIADVMSSEVVKTAIIQNSSVKILLQQSGNQQLFEELADMMALSPRRRAMVLSINRANDPDIGYYREACFILGDKVCLVAAVLSSREEALAFESAKEKKEPMLMLAKANGGSFIKAIETLVKA